MAGELLGAINGSDWLGKARERVQDDRYLTRLARTLISAPRPEARAPSHSDVRSFVRRLLQTEIGTEVMLPDGRIGHLRNVADHPTKTRNVVKTFVVEADDGQTLFLKRVRKLQEEPSSTAPTEARRGRAQIAVALEVDDVERSLVFWRDIAGLEVKVHERYVSVSGYIALIPRTERAFSQDVQLPFAPDGGLDRPRHWVLVFVGEKELKEIRQRLDRAGVPSEPPRVTGGWVR